MNDQIFLHLTDFVVKFCDSYNNFLKLTIELHFYDFSANSAYLHFFRFIS